MRKPRSRTAAIIDAFDPHPDLDAARALLDRSGDEVPLSPFAAALQELGIGDVEREEPKEASAEANVIDATQVARSDVAAALPIEVGLPMSAAPRMRATRVSGPFRGATGLFWLHFFTAPRTISVFRIGEAQPILTFTSARLGPSHPNTLVVHVAGGTVWIAASELDPASAPGSYAGFTVSEGTLRFTAEAGKKLNVNKPKGSSDDRIDFEDDDVDILLDVKPADPVATGTRCPAKPSVSGPDRVRIEWRTGKKPKFKIGKASATFTGQTIKIDASDGPPQRQPDLGAILFPAALHSDTWNASALQSNVVKLAGTTRLRGGWALSVVHPSSASALAEALGPGFVLFHCQDPLQAGWSGGEGMLELPSGVLAVSDGQFALADRSGSSGAATTALRMWAVRGEEGAPRVPLKIQFGGADHVAVYVCDANNGEAFYATCGADISLDRPVTIHGIPLSFGRTSFALLAIERSNGTTRIRFIALNAEAIRKPDVAIALRNAIVVTTQPALFILDGTLGAGGAIDDAVSAMVMATKGWFPTLPDPYVTNRPLPKKRSELPRMEGPMLFAAFIRWSTPAEPKVEFFGFLREPFGAVPSPTTTPSGPMGQSPDQIRVPTQTAQGAAPLPPQLAPTGQHLSLVWDFSAQQRVLEPWPDFRGLRLLDVSTGKDLLGVEVFPGPGNTPLFVVGGLDVATPALLLRVFALPQVQWEPVRTLDRDQDLQLGYFPTPLASVTDGGATQLGVVSQRLMPAIPDLAVEAMLDEFSAGREAGLLTTLPFGLKAFLQLRPNDTDRTRDLILRNEPQFQKPDLRGGAQLAFIAESGPSGRRQSSFFNGATVQLLNGVSLADGSPLGISVLGSVVDPADSVQEMFNNEFALPGGTNPRVPVTRLEVSGYGGSCFSDWVNPDASTGAARIQFQVLVGRTALEVVKFASVLYPWGIRVTRTVTIERKGGGGVIRRDTGWQPASEGLFEFAGASYHTQPGLLRGLFSIRNIRSTGMPPVQFTGAGGRPVVLAPKFFDARVKIDGLEGPSEIDGVGILGFLKIQPDGPLTAEELRVLLAQQGPPGGPVDGIVNVGGSGFRVRATRVEVGLGQTGAGDPELVGTVRCAPVFKQDGSWSAVRGPGPSNAQPAAEYVNANEVQGLPVVREGELVFVTGNVMNIGPQSDIRFCDAADLHRPDDPQFEYAILQTSPAHCFLFPRPHVVEGVSELRSRTVPRFADTLARGTTKGLFPSNENAITLAPNTLIVHPATGGFRLANGVNVAAPRGPIVIAQRGSDVIQLDYANAQLAFTFDQTSWNVDLRGVEFWTDVLGISKVAGIGMRVTGGTTVRPVMHEIKSLLWEPIEDALTFLGGLAGRPDAGPFDLTAANSISESEVSIFAGVHFTVPPQPIPHTPVVKFTLGLRGHIGRTRDHAPPAGGPITTLSVGATAVYEVEGKIPIKGPLFLLLGAELELGGAAHREDMEPWHGEFLFEVKAFIGVGVEAGPFEGSLAIGYQQSVEISASDSVVKHGVFVVLEAELDLEVLKIGVSGELGGLWYDLDVSHLPNRHASDCAGEIAVHVEVLFFSFSESVEFSTTKYFP